MNAHESISISIAGVALIISVISIITSIRNSSAMIELTINERITTTKEKVGDVSNIMTPLLAKENPNADEKRMIDLYLKQFDLAIENNLNAYEEACAKFLDKKVDKKRFKKIYKTEIRKLVEHKEFKKYFDGVTSNFKAILKVYKQWEDLEK
jgi:ribosomal protein L17